jgi:adenylate cyclase
MDFESEGLLDGLEGKERAARRALLERLAEEGVGLDELRRAAAEDRLVLLPVERALRGRYTVAEVAKKAQVPEEFVISMVRALGLPEPGADEALFGEDDVEAFRSTKLFLEAGFDEEAVAQIRRVLGEGMSRLAATIAPAFGDAFLQAGDDEDEVARRFAAMAEQLTPALTPVLSAAFKAHLRDNISRGVLRQAEREFGQLADSEDIAVCFADLVGFTRLGGEVEGQELGTLANRLAELAGEVAAAPTRLVKTIGDAAMLVSREVPPLVEAALELVAAAEREDLPALRAGIAYGPATVRAGDFYGNSVNLASRVTGVARPGSVLCTEEVRDAAAEQFDWSFAGKHRLKGVSHPISLYRARSHAAAPRGREAAKKRPADRRRRRAAR